MSNSYSNKPLVILKTSFLVSFVFAVGLGVIFSIYKGHTLNQFLYLTYLFFVNNLLMPVSLAVIACYYIEKVNGQQSGLVARLKLIGILSFVSMLLLLIWNIMDFLFHYHLSKRLTLDYMLTDIQEQFILAAILALPLSLIIYVTYNFLDSRQNV